MSYCEAVEGRLPETGGPAVPTTRCGWGGSCHAHAGLRVLVSLPEMYVICVFLC